MTNKRNVVDFNESVKLNSKEKQEDLCCVGKIKEEDNVSAELSQYCKFGTNMWLALGKDFYI